MLTHIRPALVLLLLMTLLTGVVYPAAVTILASVLAPAAVEGSLVRRDGVVVGSALIGQAFSDPGYLQPRPSAGDYNADPSAASNLAPTNAALVKAVADRVAAYRAANGVTPPIDAVTTSGSGLDPDISPANAFRQADRIAAARRATPVQVLAVLHTQVKGRWLGLFGQDRVNVLAANLALDASLPKAPAAGN
ncbi:MAG: potassium-transporting ATPase subunit KdpC [Rhodobacteraceae bacterium]|nr:potassium-transporting ATPase subunit KdpC [Paracoccaceae bacterium]